MDGGGQNKQEGWESQSLLARKNDSHPDTFFGLKMQIQNYNKGPMQVNHYLSSMGSFSRPVRSSFKQSYSIENPCAVRFKRLRETKSCVWFSSAVLQEAQRTLPRSLYVMWEYLLIVSSHEHYRCRLSQSFLASELNRSERTIRRYLKELAELGWIEITHLRNEETFLYEINLYKVQAPEEVMMLAEAGKNRAKRSQNNSTNPENLGFSHRTKVTAYTVINKNNNKLRDSTTRQIQNKESKNRSGKDQEEATSTLGGLNREDEVVKKRPPSPESPSVQNQTTSAAAEPVVSRPDDGTDSNSTTFSSAHHTHPSHNGSHGMKKPDFDYDAYDKYVNNIVNRRPHSRQRSGPASSPTKPMTPESTPPSSPVQHSNRDSNRNPSSHTWRSSAPPSRPCQPSRSEKYASEAEFVRGE